VSNLQTIGFGRDIFGAEHEAYRESVRRFFRTEIEPNAAQWQRDGQFPPELFRRAGSAGLLAAGIPEEYGGSGGDILHEIILHEEHAYSPAGASLEGGLRVDMVAYTLLYCGTEEQKRAYIPRFARGELISEVALSEPGAGSDLRGIKTYARRDSGDYILQGSKMWLTNGPILNFPIVAAKTDTGKGDADPISMFILPLEEGIKGVTVSKPIELMIKGSGGTGMMFFDNVRIPARNLLGGVEGKGLSHALSTMALARTAIGARSVAACELAIELTLEFVKNRKAFGQRIFDFQNTQFKLASAKAETAVGRAFIDSILPKLLAAKVDPTLSAIAKLWPTETANRVLDECLQLFGGAGFSDEYPISKMYASARGHRIQAGTSEIMRLLIARSI
jgi:acyl-CoA dehydrogenase